MSCLQNLSGHDMEKMIGRAVRLLQQGGLIGLPTETYYGLGVDPLNQQALERLFQVKQRSPDKAVLVLVADRLQVDGLAASIPPFFSALMEAFWPGPLTLIFPARKELPELLTGGTGTVGIRQSSHPVAMQLVKAFGGPITATSANRSGGAPATSATAVQEIFGREVDFVVDGGATPGGQGSTLVAYDHDLSCVRRGRISMETIRAAVAKETGR